MPIPLLSTKLFIPQPRRNQVSRERLLQRLYDGVIQGRPLVLVSAAAGFGKTTLVSAWLHLLPADWAIVWVSLDESDNDPALFVRYLVTGLQTADPDLGASLQPVLSTVQASGQLPPLVELSALLINAISQAGKKLLLVLDDYHRITSPNVHAFIQMLVEHHPEGLYTVIVTREDPPFPLSRLRARGQVTEIRERDLRFTQDEAEAFFDQSMGLDLRPSWVTLLETRTEGWVAGLQLAALAIQENHEPASIERFLQTFAGSDRYVIDYLLDEVYNRQPAELQDFLLRSSVLERMSAPLCDELLAIAPGHPAPGQSAALFQRLERGNLFLIPLDNQRRWYRYHHLFAELLRHRLLQEKGSDFTCELHRVASRWFEAQGEILDAIRHALQTRDWEDAIGLIERYAMTFVSRSQIATLLEWYRQIPEPVLRERPLASLYMAWALVLIFREDYRPNVEAWLQRAEQALESPSLPETVTIGPGSDRVTLRDFVAGQIATIRSQNLLAGFHDPIDPQALIALSQQALALLPPIARIERSVCHINLALAYLIMSRADDAEISLGEAYPLTLEAENYFGASTVVWYRARLAFYRGRISQADAICGEGMERLRSVGAAQEQSLPAIRSLYVVQALIRYEQNRLEEARQLLERSLDLTGWAPWIELWAFTLLARLQRAQGNLSGATETLKRMENQGPQHAVCATGLRVLNTLVAAPEDPQALAEARLWSQANPPNHKGYGIVTGLGPYHCDTWYLRDITWARLQVELGEAASALGVIEPVLEAARQNNLPYRVVELAALKALALEAGGERNAALTVLGEALALGKQYGYQRVFDQGPALDRLMLELARGGSHQAMVEALEKAFNRSFLGEGVLLAPKKTPARLSALVEPLSERELEVLGLIATGCSNAEIAARLVIAFGTVKRHINNIYGKLGVKSRTQAIDKARQLGLLS